MKITYFPYSLINYSILKALVTYTSTYHFTKYIFFQNLAPALVPTHLGRIFRIPFIYDPAFSIYGLLLVPVPLSIRILDFRYMVGKAERGLAA